MTLPLSGTSCYSNAVTNTVLPVKAATGVVFGWHIGNNNAAISYVQIYNIANASSVSIGNSVAEVIIEIPASTTATFSLDVGVSFSQGITVAATTTRTGNSGPSASVDLNLFYK